VYDLGLPDTAFTDSAAQELDLITENTRSEVLSALRALPPMQSLEAPLPDHLERHLDEVERDILVRALERHRFNRTAAGASLGLSLRQMRYRMARLGVHAGADLPERD
jgi:two-component system response regulator PilR (NtrC family)